ncbi:MFS amine transporter [Aspergillus ambiguus]|uniref:MFS transporter n=1 Tax=Aspergillus ambiguus TaxID=176160 RepID=UPI003CCCA56F
MEQNGSDNTKSMMSSAPWKLQFRSSRPFIISVVAMAIFADVFIYGMVVPILPTVLRTRAAIPDDELQKWMSILLAAFGGALLIGSPVCGYFSDKSTSRRVPFIIGLLALGGSTVMFWVATTVSALVVARVLQGLSAAVVWTVGMALVVDTVGQDQVGSAMGYVSMAMTVGTVFGPFIGGTVLTKLGYHAVFVIAIAIIVLDIVLRLFMIEQRTAAKWLQPVSESDSETDGLLGGTSSQDVGYGAAGGQDEAVPTCSAGNGEPDSDGRASSVPAIVRLMCSGTVLVSLGGALVAAMIWASFDTVLPLHVMETFKWDAFLIGLCFLPLFAPSFLSPRVGDAVDRYGARLIAFLGFLLDLPTLLLLQLVRENTALDKALLFVFLFLAGVASTLQNVALTTEVSVGVGELERKWPGIFGRQGGMAQAYGLFNVAWSGGQVLGPLLAGLLSDLGGWRVLVTVLGSVSGATALMILQSDSRILRRFVGRR